MKKTNNKGFSLIELIIVIAIMAVLVAIIAPNLTKYLGQSKENTDKKNLDEIEATLNTCITDYEMNYGTLLTKGDNTGITSTWTSAGSSFTGSFKSIVDAAIDATKTESKQTAGKYAIAKITRDSSGLYKIEMSWQS